jgi:predicted nucleotidyltransferase
MAQYTNERVKKIIKKYLKNINKKFKLEKTILFGSRARGDYFLNSDVDIILISKDFKKLPFRKRMAEVMAEWDEYIDIEPLCYTPEEFEKKKKQIGIVKQAVKEGILLE